MFTLSFVSKRATAVCHTLTLKGGLVQPSRRGSDTAHCGTASITPVPHSVDGTASIIRPPACGTPTPVYGTPGSKGTHHLYCLRSYHRSYLTCQRAHIRTSSTLSPMSLIEPSQGHLVSEIILKHYQCSFTTDLMLPQPCVALPSNTSQKIVFFSLMC